MTLVIAAIGRESIWITADRRLSIRNKSVSDDAVKIMSLERNDDKALLGYSGLGRTPGDIQPSEWMCGVLRGRNVPLEQSLSIIAEAIDRQIPKYLSKVPGLGNRAHVVLAPAFVANKPQLFTLELDIHPSDKRHRVRFHRYQTEYGTPASYAIAGSGAQYLVGQKIRLLSLLRLIRKHEDRKVSANTVAKEFARLNLEVSLKESSVGPNCVVAWAYRKAGSFRGGGAFNCFEGLETKGGFLMPSNVNGMDMHKVFGVLAPMLFENLKNMMAGKPEKFDEATINEALSKLPDQPDEKF